MQDVLNLLARKHVFSDRYLQPNKRHRNHGCITTATQNAMKSMPANASV
jgi:hypothetical protein